jgi:hypothetical protein
MLAAAQISTKTTGLKFDKAGTHSSRPSNLAAVLGPIKAEP